MTNVYVHVLAFGLILVAPVDIVAQERGRPRLLVGVGIGGQLDGDQDLGAGGLTLDLGFTWRVSDAARARVTATAFALPMGQGSHGLSDPPLGVQTSHGLVVALQTVRRASRFYGLGGASFRWGGFRSLAEHQSAGLLIGLGREFGANRRRALEIRYEHLVSKLGGTRALIPLQFTWRF